MAEAIVTLVSTDALVGDGFYEPAGTVVGTVSLDTLRSRGLSPALRAPVRLVFEGVNTEPFMAGLRHEPLAEDPAAALLSKVRGRRQRTPPPFVGSDLDRATDGES